MKHRICGVIASVATMLPLGMSVGFYAIPIIVLEESFSSMFNGILAAALLFGVMYLYSVYVIY